VKTFCAIVLTIGLCSSLGFGQATITQISNAASASLSVPSSTGAWQTLPNGNIAQGSFFSIYGNGLAAALSSCGTLVSGSPCIWPNSYPLPTTLNGTTVSVTVGGTNVSAYVEFASQLNSTLAQVNAVLPSNTPVGTGTLTVTYTPSGGTAQSATASITVVPASFGTFAFNNAGSGPGIIMNAKYSAFTPFSSATPNETVILWGTGLGPTTVEGTGPPPVVNLCAAGSTCPVTVWVGNEKATVAFAGRSGYTAIDQINFTLPSDVVQGCYVPVAVVTTSGSSQVTSNFTSMTISSNGGVCQDADGINYADISTQVTANGKASVGVISLLSNYLDIVGLALWDNDTANGEIATLTTGQLESFQGFTLAPTTGTCTVSQFQSFPPPKDPILPTLTYLDAGASLSIQGSAGTGTISKNSDGEGYGGLLGGAYISCPASMPDCPSLLSGTGGPPFYLTSATPPAIVATTYNVSGSGGTQVGAISGSLAVSSAAASFSWTNSSIAGSPIPRSSPLTIQWSGGDPNGFVDITLVGSTVVGLLPAANTPGELVECVVPSVPNSFSIPTFVLQAMPASAAGSLLAGEILVGPASGGVKIATPTGLDAAYLFYHFINGTTTAWQ
jgi:uncharacterized protein (TIGR03437 family)